MASLNLHPAPSVHDAGSARADRLLAEAVGCEDEERAARLRQEAVVTMLDLADALARRYRDRGVDTDDLTQVARMALVKSARGYRPDHGSGFAAYATATILGELKRHFRDVAWSVRPPRRLQEQRAGLVAAEERLRGELRRSPSTHELAAALEIAPDQVREAISCSSAYRADSLDAPNPRGVALRDLIPAERDAFDALETRATLATLVGELSGRERRLLYLRFVEEQTQTQIGHALGVSQMQVSRLLSAVVGRLRRGLLGAADGCLADDLTARRAG